MLDNLSTEEFKEIKNIIFYFKELDNRMELIIKAYVDGNEDKTSVNQALHMYWAQVSDYNLDKINKAKKTLKNYHRYL